MYVHGAHGLCISCIYFPLCSRAAEKAFASKIRATEQDYNGKIADLTGRVRPEVAITHARSCTKSRTHTCVQQTACMLAHARTDPLFFASTRFVLRADT